MNPPESHLDILQATASVKQSGVVFDADGAGQEAKAESPQEKAQSSLPGSGRWLFWPSPSQPSQQSEPDLAAAEDDTVRNGTPAGKPNGLGGTSLAPRKSLNRAKVASADSKPKSEQPLNCDPPKPAKSDPPQRQGFLSAWGWQVGQFTPCLNPLDPSHTETSQRKET